MATMRHHRIVPRAAASIGTPADRLTRTDSVATTAITPARPLGTYDEAVATSVESRVQSLVDAGADETLVRALVRDAVTLGRTAG